MIYYRYSDFLKKKYREKVYKLPLSLPCTCPNRDGTLSDRGCIFCGDIGTGFEMYPASMDIKEQLANNMRRIGPAYGAKKYIAYFQNYTNTYLPVAELEEYLEQAVTDGIVQIALSTRPDCVSESCLSMLQQFSQRHTIDIAIELGLQTVNYHTLKKINRGHTLAEFIDTVIRIQKAGFEMGAHVILNLPWDDDTDAIETAKVLSALHVDTVKLHSLYILKDSEMGRMYQNHEFQLVSPEEYIERAILFLEYLSPEIAVQRLLARAPEGDALFCNWGMSWWKLKDEIERVMKESGRMQGKLCHYLNGSAFF